MRNPFHRLTIDELNENFNNRLFDNWLIWTVCTKGWRGGSRGRSGTNLFGIQLQIRRIRPIVKCKAVQMEPATGMYGNLASVKRFAEAGGTGVVECTAGWGWWLPFCLFVRAGGNNDFSGSSRVTVGVIKRSTIVGVSLAGLLGWGGGWWGEDGSFFREGERLAVASFVRKSCVGSGQ